MRAHRPFAQFRISSVQRQICKDLLIMGILKKPALPSHRDCKHLSRHCAGHVKLGWWDLELPAPDLGAGGALGGESCERAGPQLSIVP